MRVLCLLLGEKPERLQSLAESCLAFSPQIALSREAVFLEIGASRSLFTEKECIQRLKELLKSADWKAKMGLADNPASALAFARYGGASVEQLPVEALSEYLQPFAPEPFAGAEVFRKLGVATLGDFKKIPRVELPSRFGKPGLLAYERLLNANQVAWPRFRPEEKIQERVDFDCAAQIETFEPVFFLLKTAFQRIFLRLYARRQLLAAFTVTFHLNRLASHGTRARITEIRLPLPQGELKSVLSLSDERLRKELELRPLEDALEGVSITVADTAPNANAQRDFFSKVEEEREAWSSLVGRLQERLGPQAAFLAAPAPRLLPEASWKKTLDEKERGTFVETPLRPLRLLAPPLRLQRSGDWLVSADYRRWRFTSFRGPEKLQGEWWLEGFEREYFHVETTTDALWVFTAPVGKQEGSPRGLWLHGVYD
ncbi:MAG TPA: hypothetical protein VIH99_02325 [Bdellovibrionota bacterium]|jgi:hypothetical protein